MLIDNENLLSFINPIKIENNKVFFLHINSLTMKKTEIIDDDDKAKVTHDPEFFRIWRFENDFFSWVDNDLKLDSNSLNWVP